MVPNTNRWRDSRTLATFASSTRRSTPGRQVEVQNAGTQHASNSASTGWIEASSTAVIASRNNQPRVENSDMKRWSRAKTWSRNMARRSRYSGRSWCSIVGTVAWSWATWDSSAMAMRSRNRRWTRLDSTLRYQVPVTETASPTEETTIACRRPSSTPSTSSLSQRANSASGSIISNARPSDTANSRGSAR